MGTLVSNGVTETLTLPVTYTLTLSGLIATTTTYSGTLVATRAVPEPALLGGVGIAAMLLRRRRA